MFEKKYNANRLCFDFADADKEVTAFILFRQHQQASILAQKPGIPNPEVSKIIGEQWRRLSAESKEEWNLLAEVGDKGRPEGDPIMNRSLEQRGLCGLTGLAFLIRKRKPAINSNTQATVISLVATVEAAINPRCLVHRLQNRKSLVPSVEGSR